MLENRIGEYGLLHRIRSIGICTDKLLTFSLIVDEKAQTSDLSNSAVAYRVIEDMED